MGFPMVYKLSHLDENKFWSIFRIRWDLSQKNAKKINLFCKDNSYTIRKPMSNLVDLCCIKKFYTVIWVEKKIEKHENDEFLIKLT
jgi:hypothetical protein